MQRRLAVFCEFTLNRLTPPKLCYIGGLRNHPLKKNRRRANVAGNYFMGNRVLMPKKRYRANGCARSRFMAGRDLSPSRRTTAV